MKLNSLGRIWPPNTFATSSWLEEKGGISRQTLRYYLSKGYLEKVANSLFKRPGEVVDWSGALFTLQKQLSLKVHLSGYSALRLEGIQHNLPFGEIEQVELWGEEGTRLPLWAKNIDSSFSFALKASKVFDPLSFALKKHKFHGNYDVVVSSVERALLEVLCDVKGSHTFEEAVNTISPLLTLTARRMKPALQACNSFKARRIFFFILNYCDLNLTGKLKQEDFDLGRGNLAICDGGYYVSSLKLTVPAEYKPGERSPF